MNIPLFYKCFESCYFLLCMMKTWKSDVLKKILSVRIKKNRLFRFYRDSLLKEAIL